MVNKENIKKGFSLIAVMMILVVISIIMVLSMPLISGRHQRTADAVKEDNADGYYICYRADDNRICQQTFSNGSPVSNEDCSKPSCEFSAPSNVDHLSFRIVGGGGGGAGVRQIDASFANNFRTYYETDYLPRSVVDLKNEVWKNLQNKASQYDVRNILKEQRVITNLLSRVMFTDILRLYCGRNIITERNIRPLQDNIGSLNIEEGSFGGNLSHMTIGSSIYFYRKSVSSNNASLVFMPLCRPVTVSSLSNKPSIPISLGVGSSYQNFNCRADASGSFTDQYPRSVIPYYRFTFMGERRSLYGGYGGHPGEVVTHITTDLKSNIMITLGEGGAGGNCYSGGGIYNYSKCHGENGTPTIIDFGESSIYKIKARGGRGACHLDNQYSDDADENDRRLSANIDAYEDNYNYDEEGCHKVEEHWALQEYDRQNYFEQIRGQSSQAHEYHGVGDGGSGAGMLDKCPAGRIRTDVYSYRYDDYNQANTFNFPKNGSNVTRLVSSMLALDQNGNVSGNPLCGAGNNTILQYSYIEFKGDSPNDYTENNSDLGHVGHRGKGGAVIISW